MDIKTYGLGQPETDSSGLLPVFMSQETFFYS